MTSPHRPPHRDPSRAIGGAGHIEHGPGYSRVVEQVSESRTEVFDPVESDRDAMRVLAWLCNVGYAPEFSSKWVAVTMNSEELHDGTRAGLRSAITRAAVRVAG